MTTPTTKADDGGSVTHEAAYLYELIERMRDALVEVAAPGTMPLIWDADAVLSARKAGPQ